jgi:hypothetical protein
MKKKQPKPKTSRQLYAEWVKTLPKGTIVNTYQGADIFVATVQVPNFSFAYKFAESKERLACDPCGCEFKYAGKKLVAEKVCKMHREV